jgi:hypothetical protein
MRSMSSHYLNTDLCLVSASDLTPLIASVGRRVVVGHCGRHGRRWHATLNARGSGRFGKGDPRQDATRLLRVVAQLSGTARALWRGCVSREMNIGWQSSDCRPEGAFRMDAAIIAAIARQGISLAVTIYPACENDIP